jgi:hypothetical protein
MTDKRRTKEHPKQLWLQNYFDYDPAGHLRWKDIESVSRNLTRGEIAGGPDGRGGRRVMLHGSMHNVKDLVWIWHNGDLPIEGVVHDNLDKSDNRIENLIKNPYVKKPKVDFL